MTLQHWLRLNDVGVCTALALYSVLIYFFAWSNTRFLHSKPNAITVHLFDIQHKIFLVKMSRKAWVDRTSLLNNPEDRDTTILKVMIMII